MPPTVSWLLVLECTRYVSGKQLKCVCSGLASLLPRLPPGISRSRLPFVTAVAGAKHVSLVLQLRFGEMSLTPQCATVVIIAARCYW